MADPLLPQGADPLAITDEQGKLIWCNGPFRAQISPSQPEPLGSWIGDLLPPPATGQPLFAGQAPGSLPLEAGSSLALIAQRPLRIAEVWWLPVPWQGEPPDPPRGLIVGLRDLSPLLTCRRLQDLNARLLEANGALARELLTCPVTGLANRRGLMQELEAAIAGLGDGDGSLAVIFCDLDRFKQINDLHGHRAGDNLLLAVGQRMAAELREGDSLGRLGGDEYVVLCRNLPGADAALAIAERLQKAVGQLWRLGREVVQPSLSIGIALADQPTITAEELLRRADLAMYEAKGRPGLAGHVFAAAIDERQQRTRDLLLQLRRDMATNRLVLVFQPIVHLASGRRVGHEALVRLQGPGDTLIGPDQFVPLAERSGLIHPLGSKVLARALEQLAASPPASGESLSLAVNTSPHQLQLPGFGAEVLARCAQHGIAPGRLRLEITETSLLRPSPQTLANMHQLRAAGVQLHLDDFGTGYSSLALLSDLPINAVKIDRGFTAELGHNRSRTAVIVAVIRLCQELGLEVIAEGIETDGQRRQLLALGCGYGQGFLLGRPGPLTAGPPPDP